MEFIYLMRHGRAVEAGSTDIADDDRPLTEKGAVRVRRIADGVRLLDLKLDRIVASPLPRASRSAEIVADALHSRELLEFDDALRVESSAESVLEWLEGRAENRIMLIGHNPTLSELLSLLVLGRTEPILHDLRKGGVAALRADSMGRFRLDWLARPKLPRRWIE